MAVRTIIDFERGAREPRRSTQDALRQAFETAGVRFIDQDAAGAGVRLAKPLAAE
ncbi:MAG TPA: XRE family transcriptional regulator [Devosia sp.]|nr:XRE family transcriptional regulator [Devosia sp.]